MLAYSNLSGNSGVMAYECGKEHVLIQFRNGTTYRYSYASAGRLHVEEMKRLATAGRGLSSYISQHTRDLYDRDP